MSATLPFGAPASTHATMVLICCSERLMSFRIGSVSRMSAPHGGISRDTTLLLMARAQGRTCS